MTAMQERSAELGGTCTVAPAPAGGTRVWARLPVHVQRIVMSAGEFSVLIAEDHPVFRDGLKALIASLRRRRRHR